MKRFHVLSVTIGAGALISLGSLAAAVAADPQTPDSFVGQTMSTGVTVTQSPDQTAGQLPVATPAIKGPAPLPTEEHGLPG